MPGRFIQADTLILGVDNPLSLDRFAYVQNNPIRFNDPTGHDKCTGNQYFLPDCEATYGEWTRHRSVGEDDPYYYGDVSTQESFETIRKGIEFVGAIIFEPYDWYLTGIECLQGNCSPYVLLGLVPFIPGSVGNKVGDIQKLMPKGEVYTLSNDTGKMVRVGHTKDFVMRQKYYKYNDDYFNLNFHIEFYTDNYAERRGLEQYLYEKFLAPLLNINNPISARNGNIGT